MKPISMKKKVAPSQRVLARAFAKRKVEASHNVLQRVFSESGLERASREGVDAWFKKTVIDAFKKWHVHKDGSTPQVRIVGDEDFSGSQSDLEKSLGTAKTPAGGGQQPAASYDMKKAETKAGGAQVSYKMEDGKGGSEIKYSATTESNVSYKGTGAAGASYQQHSAIQYSKDQGANVQCSCGMVAHAGQQSDGKIGFSPIGNTKSDSGMYSMYKAGGGQQSDSGSDMYRSGGAGANYSST